MDSPLEAQPRRQPAAGTQGAGGRRRWLWAALAAALGLWLVVLLLTSPEQRGPASAPPAAARPEPLREMGEALPQRHEVRVPKRSTEVLQRVDRGQRE